MRHDVSAPTDIVSRVRDDCIARKYLQIAPEDAKLFQPKEPVFGDRVALVFPVAIDEIEAAAKCLALDQGTATVFHLMRTLEAGLHGIATELGLPYAPSWESYITQLEKILVPANYAKLTAEQHAKRPFYRCAG